MPGDEVEATRVLWLECHSLELLRELVRPAPHVLEDIAPRLLRVNGGSALLAVRSRSHGGQLGLRAGAGPPHAVAPAAVAWAGLGEAMGTPNR